MYMGSNVTKQLNKKAVQNTKKAVRLIDPRISGDEVY